MSETASSEWLQRGQLMTVTSCRMTPSRPPIRYRRSALCEALPQRDTDSAAVFRRATRHDVGGEIEVRPRVGSAQLIENEAGSLRIQTPKYVVSVDDRTTPHGRSVVR